MTTSDLNFDITYVNRPLMSVPGGRKWSANCVYKDFVIVHVFTPTDDGQVITDIDAYNTETGQSISPDYPRAGVLSETPYPDIHAANAAAEEAARAVTAETIAALVASASEGAQE